MIMITSRRPVIYLLLLIIIVNFHEVENKRPRRKISRGDKIDIVGIVVDILSLIMEVIKEGIGHADDGAGDGADSTKLDSIKSMMTDLSSQFHQMEMRTQAMLNSIPGEIEFNERKHEIADSVKKVYDFYNEVSTVVKYSRDLSTLDNVTLADLVKTLTSKTSGNLHDTLLDLKRNIIHPIGRNIESSFLDFFIKYEQTNSLTRCGSQSPNQYLYDLYETIITTELLGQIAQSFGYYMQHKFYNVDVTTALRIAQELAQNRLTDYAIRFKEYLGKASTSIRSCDPPNLIRNVTFIEMERLYTAVATEGYDYGHTRPCPGSCSDTDVRNKIDAFDRFSCKRIYQCREIPVFKYCLNPENLRHLNPRNYQYIEDKSGNTYGDKMDKCYGTPWEFPNAYRGKDWYWCQTCICTCEGTLSEKAPGVKYFSLKMSRSDIEANKVVTGIRFHRNDTWICIEIKQGKLLPSGRIEEGSEEWLKGKGGDIFDQLHWMVNPSRDHVAIDSFNNFINLDDLIVPNNHVVTGVGFYEEFNHEDMKRHIQFKVEHTEFDFSSGLLLNEVHYGEFSVEPHSNKVNIDGARNPLQEETPRRPTTPVTGSNSYIQFGMSDFKTDAGQTTLPFFDATNVESERSVPLSGVGLFYKTSPGYGGFLAFRIHTLNRGEYMKGVDKIDKLLKVVLDDSIVEDTAILINTMEKSSTVVSSSSSTE